VGLKRCSSKRWKGRKDCDVEKTNKGDILCADRTTDIGSCNL